MRTSYGAKTTGTGSRHGLRYRRSSSAAVAGTSLVGWPERAPPTAGWSSRSTSMVKSRRSPRSRCGGEDVARAGGMLKLACGDVVVYGPHGAGTVAERETRSVLGEQQTVVVVALAGGLSVQLPLALAREQLRPVVDEAGLSMIEKVLRT